jgi:hypothetical protein
MCSPICLHNHLQPDVGETYDPCRNTSIPASPQGAFRAQLDGSLNGKVMKVLAASLVRMTGTFPLTRSELCPLI